MIPFRKLERGFTIFEIVVVLAVIAVVATLGIVSANRAIEGSRSAKLSADLQSINSAVRMYLSQGGDLHLGGVSDPNSVIAQLKAKLKDEDARAFVGFKGGMVDPRLRAVMLTEKEQASAMQRAVWVSAESQFRLASTGNGIKEFVLDAAPAATEQSGKSPLKFATSSKWIWDYSDHALKPKPEFDELELRPTEAAAFPLSPASQGALMPPSMSLPSGTYDYDHFPLSVALSDPNIAGRSRILYRTDDGNWNVYSGSSVVIAPNALTTLVAYCETTNPDLWLDSVPTLESYGTFTFSGKTSGEFLGAEGSSAMVASYGSTGEESQFYWGDPAVREGHIRPSELSFTGAEFSTITLEQEFVLGTLDYFNGTVLAGTGADHVDLEVSLDLAIDMAFPITAIAFELQLVNTPNDWANNSEDQNADYVQLSVPVQQMTATVDGKTYYVHLSFGESGPESFTTGSTFHVWEGSQASGTILAKFSANPPGGEDVIRPSAVVSARSSLVGGSFNVDVTFSEYVNELSLNDFLVSNGSPSVINGDGHQFVLGVAPATDGSVTIRLPENAALDLAGNGNTASNSVIVSVDMTPPTVDLIATPAANGNFVVDTKFSEPVVGMSTYDWETTNGVVTSVIGTGADYKATIIPGSIGNVTIGLRAGAVTDAVGHSVGTTAPIAVLFDPVAPEATLTLGTTDPTATVNGMFSVNIALTDAVADIAPTDFIVTNGFTFTIVESDPSHYSISIVPQNGGPVSVFLAAGSVHDLAGNGNSESNTVIANYVPPDATTDFIDFGDYAIESWGSILFIPQDSGSATVQGGGKELRLSENAWKSIKLDYNVTPKTVLEFEFWAAKEGFTHGIGFDDDESLSSERIFQVFGLVEVGIQDFHYYPGKSWRTFSIPVGHYYTGKFDRLFFTASQDITGALDAESRFKNVRVYEQ
ncbi:MAG: choice-of-anchor K domain-containing protein [Verrucomicrobiae bacterium]|nr:choice-of-anchor K domain-containing protein [Verrucomicrobiae bacterium]